MRWARPVPHGYVKALQPTHGTLEQTKYSVVRFHRHCKLLTTHRLNDVRGEPCRGRGCFVTCRNRSGFKMFQDLGIGIFNVGGIVQDRTQRSTIPFITDVQCGHTEALHDDIVVVLRSPLRCTHPKRAHQRGSHGICENINMRRSVVAEVEEWERRHE